MAKSARRREWSRASDDPHTVPGIVDDDAAEPSDTEQEPADDSGPAEAPSRAKRFRRAVVARLPH